MKLTLIALALAASSAGAAPHRSNAERLKFVRAQACPATAQNKLPCPGFIIDHIVALCVGGADKSTNMQWLTVDAAKAKDRWECKQ